MANKIDEKLAELRSAKRKGLMTHVVVGYPSLEATAELVTAMADEGVDFVELQIPFSDPLADGPTIQSACELSLARGTKVRDAFLVAARLTKSVDIPLLFMAYFNTVYKYGVVRFCKDAQGAGIAGLIIPDIPLEAARHEGFLKACKANGLHNIITLAPTSTRERLVKNAAVATGFAYCMSREGVTGAQSGPGSDLPAYLTGVAAEMPVPLAVGFGISNRERLKAVLPYCDIAVVGSALVETIANAPDGEAATRVAGFLRELIPVLDDYGDGTGIHR